METLGQKILLRFGVDSEQLESGEEELREGREGREGENRSVELSEERGERRRGERNRGRGRRVGLEAENSPLFERPSIVNIETSLVTPTTSKMFKPLEDSSSSTKLSFVGRLDSLPAAPPLPLASSSLFHR